MQKIMILFSFLIIGCASSTEKFKSEVVRPGNGGLYVYRTNMLTDRFTAPVISINEVDQNLPSGRYVFFEVPQGKYNLKSYCMESNGTNNCPAEINVLIVGGEEHFVRFNPRAGNDIDASLSKTFGKITKEQTQAQKAGFLQYMGRPEAREEIKDLKPAEETATQ
jgi:hypothetical protein